MGVKRFTDRWKCLYLPIVLPKMGIKVFMFYSKEGVAIALVFILYGGNWTNNLLLVILFRNWAMHIFEDTNVSFFLIFI